MAQEYPAGTDPTEVTRKDFTVEEGQAIEITLRGKASAVEAAYNTVKGTPETNMLGASLEINAGRGTLVKRYQRVVTGESGDEIIETQELYAIDVIKDILTAPYFATLYNSEILAVRTAYEENEEEDSGWSALQKTLFYHLTHGVDSYFETGFIFTSTRQVSGKAALAIATTNINEVVTAPTTSGAMANLLSALPTGEWLKRPPRIRKIRTGVWEASEEWQWAKKWSVIYGGTFGAP
jgi:hypothetical protein